MIIWRSPLPLQPVRGKLYAQIWAGGSDYPDTPDTPDTPDVPTSNASVEGGIAVWTSANALHIRADRPAEAWGVGLSGASRARFAVVPGETRHALPAGVYLVRIADQTYKVRIRN